ncbi:MAG: acyclic terpene utilization AtuA family protein [Solirubrobacteraceae bacterium]
MERGIELGATAIAIDAGSTDSGPYYLGAGVSKNPAAAIKRDLRILLHAACGAQIPLIVGSCATSGTDVGVDWVADIARQIAGEDGLSFTMAQIYSEQSADTLASALVDGRIHPLSPAGELDEATLHDCEHIVGVMGHEPIVAALTAGADVVLAGRASDTSMVPAVALMHGLPAGPAWHAAKTVECGDQCTTRPRGGGVFVTIDAAGFTVTPLDPEAACTPASVAAHMLYENANPFRLAEPSGSLDTSAATYAPIDSRIVRVEGSRFHPAPGSTIKLEGSALSGYVTMSFAGIAEPDVLRRLDVWTLTMTTLLRRRVRDTMALEPDGYEVQLRCYGADAILGPLAPAGGTPQEVGVMLKIKAPDQSTATAIAKIANPLLLHLPLDGMEHLPSYAFASSPAEVDCGAAYEFRLNHIVEVDDPTALFRTCVTEVSHG